MALVADHDRRDDAGILLADEKQLRLPRQLQRDVPGGIVLWHHQPAAVPERDDRGHQMAPEGAKDPVINRTDGQRHRENINLTQKEEISVPEFSCRSQKDRVQRLPMWDVPHILHGKITM